MICLASSASSSRTEIRTSPRPSTVSGNTECGIADWTIDITPCVSRRPRTMLASTSECVRKMTTRSGKRIRGLLVDEAVAADCRGGRAQVVDLQQDQGHVVVLRRVADKRADLAQDAFAQFVGRQMRVLLDQPAETIFAE